MAETERSVFGKYYDQIYKKRKNYQNEAETLAKVISEFDKKPSKTLLDVGCGTGEHLRYLSQSYNCTGIDINSDMIRMAKAKAPNAAFRVADMTNFNLNRKFDIVTCLFSSIGYVQTFDNLVRTLKNFYNHLNRSRLAIVEPWVFKKDFRKGNVAIDTYEDEKVKLVRMATSKLTKSEWLISMHYLIGKDNQIKHVREIHKMLTANFDDYLRGFKQAGFKETQFLDANLWTRARGLFIART